MVILMFIFVILTISAFGLLGDLCSEGFDIGCSTYFHFLCIQSSRAYMDTLSERGAAVAAAGAVAISFTHHERSGRLATKIGRCLFF